MGKIPGIKHFAYTGDLENDIRTECSGDISFDIETLLNGNYDRGEQPIQDLINRYEHERSGSVFVKLRNYWPFKNNPIFKNMDQDYLRAVVFYKKYIENKSELKPNDEILMRTLVQRAHLSMDQFRRLKSGVASLSEGLVAGSAAALGTLPALFITGLPYTTVAITAGIFSATSRWIFMKKFAGRSFGKHEKAWTLLKSTIDGVSIFINQLGRLTAITMSTLGRHIGTSMSKKLVKTGVKAGLHRFIEKAKQSISSRKRAEHILNGIKKPQLYRGPGMVSEQFNANMESRSTTHASSEYFNRSLIDIFESFDKAA